ncbi:dihydroneopterin aldolase [Aliarcobacter skirrowii]|uniref:dihydroneopterin aldolase n=1 Tax=Aliarcobacter skirrowii TaxID=28200 RepID=UPI000825A758|nr:dihydroneopterin aldolase [Aliarcobacter skirrowii]MCT7445688.1 dihydroneopterin aldolase [Aliarcobacter skirrowii]MDX4047873.1 dihydroneopterin aldolase [Aliarcobacter skirrowii]MDX4049496.1 dihydroneopterin aldolase [Aliarcobacter skirrowii]MDX4062882.1 dihydroneopterin aldolase [Aliarcobacter skirrowii]MDX4064824.1 dihydroneopterin aldolase [Aliarcobacter skirrowii]
MKIEIENLSFKTIIGILDFERVKKQKVIINISFEYEFKNGEFIDYAEVSKLIKNRVKQMKYFLLEDALEDLKQILNENYDIFNLKLKITKPAIMKDCIVSLSI